MDYRRLGRTGLKVSCFCLGTMQWGWTTEEPTAFAVMDAFVERGGNFLDTADFYSRWLPGHVGGESEEIIGRWMRASWQPSADDHRHQSLPADGRASQRPGTLA